MQNIEVVFLQEVILRPGTLHRESDNWSMVASKQATEWRGVGIAHKKTLGGHRNTHGHTGGITTTLLLKGGTKIRCLSGHIPHHATIPETNVILAGWGAHLGSDRLVVGMDANEVFTQPFTSATNSATGRGECVLQWASEHNITFPLQDITTPTHHPYNTRLAPRRLDYVACRSTSHKQGGVVACRHRAATDHDGVKLTLQLDLAKDRNNPDTSSWGPRRLKTEGAVEHALSRPPPRAQDPHLSIANMAKAITTPGRTTLKYRESPELKQLRHKAHQLQGGEARQAWKQVKKQKEQEHKQWLRQKAEEASCLSWGAFRSLQHHRQRKQGWQLPLTDPPDWENQLREHFRGIFNKVSAREVQEGMQHIRKALERLCKLTPWRPFEPGEVAVAVSRWAKNKSCGPDGISHEAITAMLQHPQWESIILSELNDMLYKGAIHSSVGKGLTVLLPKIAEPQQWGDCRPITLSSTMLKLLAQLLLGRAGTKI